MVAGATSSTPRVTQDWLHGAEQGLEEIGSGFIDILNSLYTVFREPVPVITAMLAFLTLLLVYVLVSRIARLLYQSLYVGVRFGRLRAARDVFALIRESPINSLRFQAVQVLIETAILRPVREPPKRLDTVSRDEYRQQSRSWRKDRREWRRETLNRVGSLLRGATNAQLIQVDNVGQINDARDRIRGYFGALVDIGHSEPAFFSEVEVCDGFIAPLFLITGLIDTFSNWNSIIDPFGKHMSKPNPIYGHALAEQRLFLFDCWLLWGPSIPVCQCRAWKGGNTAIQYGYGDENRSVDLILRCQKQQDLLPPMEACLIMRPDNTMQVSHVLAGKATAKGVLRWGPMLAKEKLNSVQQTIRDPTNMRLVLDVADAKALSAAGGTGEDALARYYSAYFWIMFVICERSTGLPVFDTSQGWRNLLPFFEHGNLASATTLAALKRNLIAKTADSIARILMENPGIALKYACAFDHDAPDHPALFPPPPGTSLRSLLREKAIANADLQAAISARRLFIEDQMVEGYNACDLPSIITKYYDEVRQMMA